LNTYRIKEKEGAAPQGDQKHEDEAHGTPSIMSPNIGLPCQIVGPNRRHARLEMVIVYFQDNLPGRVVGASFQHKRFASSFPLHPLLIPYNYNPVSFRRPPVVPLSWLFLPVDTSFFLLEKKQVKENVWKKR
jgi:hypothetical protein